MAVTYPINLGTGNTGLSLSFAQFLRVDTWAAVTAPSIVEIAGSDGDYYFVYDWSTAPVGVTDIWCRIEAAGVKIVKEISIEDQYQYADVVAIKTKTDNLPSDPASNSSVKGVSNKDLSQVDADVQSAISSLQRLLGLSYDNIYEDQQVYSNGRLTSARLRCYDSAADALAAGATGLLYTYAIAAAYDVNGNCTSFSMTRNP